MDEKPKTTGRGSKLLEMLRSRNPGSSGPHSLSDAPSEKASKKGYEVPQPSTSSEINIEKASYQKSQSSEFSKNIQSKKLDESEFGVARCEEVKSQQVKMGRGNFLAQLMNQYKQKVGVSSIEMPHTSARSSAPSPASDISESFYEKFEGISVDRETPIVRKGEVGEKITVCTNYVTLTVDPGKGVFEYDVRFQPEIDYVAFRYNLIHEHFKKNRGIKCYDGSNKLYLPEIITQSKLIIEAKHPNNQSPVQILVTFKRQMRQKECSQLYNILFNNCAKVLNLSRLGRQHFDSRLAHQIPQFKLEVWPGYITAVEEFEGGIHLYCDITHRLLRTDLVYDVLVNIAKLHAPNLKVLALKELLGQCVLTRYNNNLYRIDDIDWDKTPSSTFMLNSGKEVTFLQYYKEQYNLNISDLKQPLLLNRKKVNKKDKNTQLIYLVPELCHMTGLTDKMRKDMKVMKEIAAYTRVTPVQRQLGLKKFLDNIKSNQKAQEMLRDWGLTLAEEPKKLDARILPKEDLFFKNNIKIPTPLNVEWSKCIRNYGVLRSVDIKHWLLVHTNRDTNLANSFTSMIRTVGPGLGINIDNPFLVRIKDDKIDSYIRGLKDNINSKTQIIVCLCPTPRDDRYSAIKKFCCRELPVPSQIVNCGTLNRENRMRAVVQNVALQMNNKLGGATWSLHLPLKNCMICGIDSYHDRDKRGNSVGAFVASVDGNFTQWYSKTCIQEPRQELLDGLVFCFVSALKKFLSANSILPERIVIFRDGVGDGQLAMVQNHEVQQFLDACLIVSKNYQPKFSFVVVQKKSHTKFFRYVKEMNLENCSSGSVLDHTITRRNYYDFFLVSQHVSCGTATPSHYIVLYDSSGLKPDLMQRLTYKFCHLYYNWAGTICVPAPCQYAHKLAYLVGQHLNGLPSDFLEDVLYYL